MIFFLLPVENKAFLKQLGQTFSDVLVKGSSGEMKYFLIDFYSFDLNFDNNYQTLFSKNVTTPAFSKISAEFIWQEIQKLFRVE